MRTAKSYGIVDHELLHGRYLHRLSHEGLSFYLFLSVVSDSAGKSFYGEKTICEILRFSPDQFRQALQEMIDFRLLDFRRPYFWLKNLEASHE